jgi:hypothetical protein
MIGLCHNEKQFSVGFLWFLIFTALFPGEQVQISGKVFCRDSGETVQELLESGMIAVNDL